MKNIYYKQTTKRLYYTEHITLQDYGDNQLECSETLKSSPFSTGNKQIKLYEITNNEPKQIDWILLTLEDDSRLEVYDYLQNK